MKTFYLSMAAVGSFVVNTLMLLESLDGNVLLYTRPADTFAAMTANRISTIFSLDLFLLLPTTFAWMWREARTQGIRRVWIFWLLAAAFGLATALPLFLYVRERRRAPARSS